ncbi:MAG: alpha/beta hydrolase [Patescibacteria group bacterium]|jgi:hypothetical protein
MKRVFIIHRWSGSPEKDWLPWLVRSIQTLRPSDIQTHDSYEVFVPSMPDPDVPTIENWTTHLKHLVGKLLPTDVFIGHSIGCQTILRYLEKLPAGEKADKVILVAPFLTLKGLETEEEFRIAKPWLRTLIDLRRIPDKANSYTLLFSDNDPFVPLDENVQLFKKWINPEIHTLHDKGHFTQDDGIVELPELLNFLRI